MRPWTLDTVPVASEVPVDGKLELRSVLPLGFDAAGRRVVVWRR
jgi:hypothetical protein